MSFPSTQPRKIPQNQKETAKTDNISLGDVISDGLRQLRRRGLNKKFQPYTREEILHDTLDSEKYYHLYKAMEGALNRNTEGLKTVDLSTYFKRDTKTISSRFYERIGNPEKADISSQEVLNLTKHQNAADSEELPLVCIAVLGFYHTEEAVVSI